MKNSDSSVVQKTKVKNQIVCIYYAVLAILDGMLNNIGVKRRVNDWYNQLKALA